MPSIPTILCSPTLVDWNSYHKFHRHMKTHLSNNYLNLLLPSFPDSRRWCIYLINCLYLLVNWHFRHTFHENHHINPPLQQLIALLVLPPPFFFSTSAPSPFLHASPPRIYLFTQPGLQAKKKSSHIPLNHENYQRKPYLSRNRPSSYLLLRSSPFLSNSFTLVTHSTHTKKFLSGDERTPPSPSPSSSSSSSTPILPFSFSLHRDFPPRHRPKQSDLTLATHKRGNTYKKLTYPAIENGLLRSLLLPNPCIRDSFGAPGLVESGALVFEVGSCRLLHPFVLLHPWQSHNSNSLSFLSKSALLVPSLFFKNRDPPVCLLFAIDDFGVSRFFGL